MRELNFPRIHATDQHPTELAEELSRITGREVLIKRFDQFRRDFSEGAKSPEPLHIYGILTVMFPRCIAAVRDGSEIVASQRQMIDRWGSEARNKPLVLLGRDFPGCKHALMALYDWHPVNDSPWNDALYDHIRIWTWTECEICTGAAMQRDK